MKMSDDIVVQKFEKYDQWKKSSLLLAKYKKSEKVLEIKEKPSDVNQTDCDQWTN